jgi:diguanylate cyclase (GGDEF)-like protein/hemerythrin-like metal-binding protein/PAS domain S-box-containing protein
VIKLRGYTPEEIIAEPLDASLTPESAAYIKSLIRQQLDENRTGDFPADIFYTNTAEQPCKDGTTVWTEVITNYYRNKETGRVEIQGVTRDITERKKAEKELHEANLRLESLSITDGLTSIANRRHFDTVLTQEIARHARSGAELSLIMLDIDHFKAFNDSYGHVKGDECLRAIGQVLRECAIRPADLAARYGGEEFACILPETDYSGAVIIAEKIRREIQTLAIPHKASSTAECVTASLGVITMHCSTGELADEILAKVDALLYRAKSTGRNRVEFVAAHDITLTAVAKEFTGTFVRLVWEDSFCSGNQLIDTQHRALFNVSNNLLEAVLSGHSSTAISHIITQLLDDASQHFRDEQKILETADFPGVSQHIIEHAELLAKGLELLEQFKAATLSVGDVFQFLVSDLVKIHMLVADREYFPFIRHAVTAIENEI